MIVPIKVCPIVGKRVKDYTGIKKGRLTFIKHVPKPNHIAKGGGRYWLAKCDCGGERILCPGDVFSVAKKAKDYSCGCWHKEKMSVKGARNFSYTGYEQVTGTFVCYLKDQAKRRGKEFNLTAKQLWDLWELQKGKCALSGIDLTITLTSGVNQTKVTASLDRIDSNVGYVEGNVQWVHKKINIMKNNLDDSTFIQFCRKVYLNNLNKNKKT
jgi:hypothetical protein